jgi:hypothetical protein
MDIQRVLIPRGGEERRRREAMSTVATKSAVEAIKELIEQGKTDEEIVKWIEQNLPHVKNPKAYLRATKSYLRKKAAQQVERAESGSAATPLSTLGIQVQQVEIPRPKAEKVEKEIKEVEAEEAPVEIEVDEEALTSMYKGIIEIIGIVATGEDFAFPEAKARSRAKLLKKIIEKHNLGGLPWEELSLLGGVAEDALYVFNKVREKKAKEKAKTALGQKAEKEEKAEEKKEEQQVKPDMRSLREKLKQIYANAGV